MELIFERIIVEKEIPIGKIPLKSFMKITDNMYWSPQNHIIFLRIVNPKPFFLIFLGTLKEVKGYFEYKFTRNGEDLYLSMIFSESWLKKVFSIYGEDKVRQYFYEAMNGEGTF